MKLGFVLIAPEDAARLVAALAGTADPALRAIATRLKEGGAREDKAAAGPRLVSSLWETYSAVRKAAPISVAQFFTTQKPFPGIDGTAAGGRPTRQAQEERVETCVFCILAQPNGVTSDVRAYLCEQWSVTDHTLSRILKHASERLKGQSQPDDDLRAKIIAHGWNTYQEALRANRPQAAVGALDGIARNAGLTKEGSVNIINNPQVLAVFERTSTDLLAALDAGAAIAARTGLPAEMVERVLGEVRATVEGALVKALGPAAIATTGEAA